MEQRSPEWFQTRAGKVTASRVADVIAKTKTGASASRANYMAQLICERLTGCVEPGFTSSAMQHGIDCEPLARAAYEEREGVAVVEVGFVPHPEIAMAGCSPDGLVGEDGMLEIKCPQPAGHIETLESGAVPAKYITQMMFQMACTGRAYCDYVSYCPSLPANMQLFVKRVPRDVGMILDLEQAVSDFIAEIDAKVARLTEEYGLAA